MDFFLVRGLLLRVLGILALTLTCLAHPRNAFAGGLKAFRLEAFEFRTGYGWQYTNQSRPNNFQVTPLLPSWVFPLSGPLGPAWFRGRFLWNPEGVVIIFSHPFLRAMVGVTPIQFQYALQPMGCFSPYFFAGAGVLRGTINRRETRAHTNFNLQGGMGTRYALTGATSLILEYRHTHISNAGLDEDNSGINTHTFLVGVSIKK